MVASLFRQAEDQVVCHSVICTTRGYDVICTAQRVVFEVRTALVYESVAYTATGAQSV